MSEIKVNSIKGTGASTAAITVNSSDGTCTANITNNLSNRNLIINGAMQVAQRGTSSTTNGYGSVDRFRIAYDSGLTEAPTQSQISLTSSDTPYALGFRNAFRITNGNQTSQSANDYILLRQKIEAQNMACSGWNYTSASSYVTLSFWVKVSVAQTMYVRVLSEDSPGGEQYSFAFSATTSWTKITKTIPGASGVVFNNDNGTGLNISFIPFYGTSYTTSGHTNDVWEDQDGANQLPDMANTWFSVNDATFDVTGVQLEVGSVATDFEHLSYAKDLALCQRYFERVVLDISENYIFATNQFNSGTQIHRQLKTTMRATPTVTLDATTFSHYKIAGSGSNGTFTASPTSYSNSNITIQAPSITASTVYWVNKSATGYADASAEL